MGAEKPDREWPGLTRGREVRAVLAVLLAKESVTRADEAVDLERLAQSTHGGVRRRYGCAHAGVVTGVKTKHWDSHARQRCERRRRAVVDDGRAKSFRAHDGMREGRSPSPAEADSAV